MSTQTLCLVSFLYHLKCIWHCKGNMHVHFNQSYIFNEWIVKYMPFAFMARGRTDGKSSNWYIHKINLHCRWCFSIEGAKMVTCYFNVIIILHYNGTSRKANAMVMEIPLEFITVTITMNTNYRREKGIHCWNCWVQCEFMDKEEENYLQILKVVVMWSSPRPRPKSAKGLSLTSTFK